jgi:integrase
MSLWQDDSGVWRCRYLADGTKQGPYLQRKLGEMPAAEAKRRYEILRGRAAARRDGFSEAPTFAELVEEWEPIRLPDYSPSWRAQAERVLKDRLLPRLGHLILDEEGGLRRGPRLTLLEIARYRAARLKDGTKPATRNRELGLVKSIIRLGEKWGSVRRLAFPLHAISAELEQEKTVWIEPGEWGRLRDVLTWPEAWAAGRDRVRVLAPAKEGAARRFGGPRIPGSEDDLQVFRSTARILPVLEALLFTGSRFGEILSLRWDQVDLKGGRIAIEQAKLRGRVKNATKNQDLIPEMKALLERQPRGIGKALVFAGPAGGGSPWERRHFQRLFARAREVAGIRSEITIHSIRHTTASWLVQSGYGLLEAQKILGHSQSRTTERYAHLAPASMTAPTSAVASIAASGSIGRRESDHGSRGSGEG